MFNQLTELNDAIFLRCIKERKEIKQFHFCGHVTVTADTISQMLENQMLMRKHIVTLIIHSAGKIFTLYFIKC